MRMIKSRSEIDCLRKAQRISEDALAQASRLIHPGVSELDIMMAIGISRTRAGCEARSLGLEIHEEPRFNPTDETLLRPGMVITVEPGIYIPGAFGVRIEDMVLITEDGFENLNNRSRHLRRYRSQNAAPCQQTGSGVVYSASTVRKTLCFRPSP